MVGLLGLGRKGAGGGQRRSRMGICLYGFLLIWKIVENQDKTINNYLEPYLPLPLKDKDETFNTVTVQ